MPAERFDFPNAQGQKLAALLDRPVGEPRAYALFAHCFTCGKDIHAAKRVAEERTEIHKLRDALTSANTSFTFASITYSRDQVKDKAGKKHDIVVLGHNPAEVQAQLEAYGLPDAVQH